jgi:hypothetical protein
MAVLDPRILDLIETLTAARMDWLAFELIEAIQTGHMPIETPDTLAVTRRKVREDDQPKATGEPKLVSQESQPIEGDDQIDWAAKYVAERLSATLAYLTQSIENLDAIAGGDVKNPAAMSEDAGEPLVVLADGDVQRKAGRAEVDAAIAALPQLRHSLKAWSAQVRGQAQI